MAADTFMYVGIGFAAIAWGCRIAETAQFIRHESQYLG